MNFQMNQQDSVFSLLTELPEITQKSLENYQKKPLNSLAATLYIPLYLSNGKSPFPPLSCLAAQNGKFEM